MSLVLDADREASPLAPVAHPSGLQMQGMGKWPEPRSFPAACAEDKEFVVLEGVGAAGRVNDLWSFNPSTSSWTCLHPGGPESEAPVARGGAAICATRDVVCEAVKQDPEACRFASQKLRSDRVFILDQVRSAPGVPE